MIEDENLGIYSILGWRGYVDTIVYSDDSMDGCVGCIAYAGWL